MEKILEHADAKKIGRANRTKNPGDPHCGSDIEGREKKPLMPSAMAYFRNNPRSPGKCELVVAIDGVVTTIPFSRRACINAIRILFSFVEKIPNEK